MQAIIRSVSLQGGIWRNAGEKAEVRFQATLARLSGEPAEAVQTRFNISRGSLYEYKRCALAAMREALKDERHGPRHPHNRIAEEKEQAVALTFHQPRRVAAAFARRKQLRRSVN